MNVDPPSPQTPNEPGSQSSCEPETSQSKSRRAAIVGGATLLAALSAAVLLLSERNAPAPDASAGSGLGAMSMTPSVRLPQRAPSLILFIPDQDGQLKRRTVSLGEAVPSDVKAAKEKLATLALRTLMDEAPDNFPSGAQMQGGVRIQGEVPTVSFNRAFTDPSFWQGSARTLATLDSIALTVKETKNQFPGDERDSIRILVEGKAVSVIGEMDLSEPYQPSETESGR
jgi:hypothetical protein